MINDNLDLEPWRNLHHEIRDLRREVQNGFKDMRARMASLELHESAQSEILHGTVDASMMLQERIACCPEMIAAPVKIAGKWCKF